MVMICLIVTHLSSFFNKFNLHSPKTITTMSTTTTNSLRRFVEKELGSFPHFVIYALLEWFLILLLFLDGFLAFFSSEFAKFFELHVPCVLCSRLEHVLVHQGMNSYYNSIICEHHKKDVSSLAYCHVHRNLSDIRTMCEGCLLSFVKEKGHDADSKIVCPVVADSSVGEDVRRCSCCGDLMKSRTGSKGMARLGSSVQQLMPISPRSQVFGPRNEDGRPLQLQLKFMSGNDSDILDDEYIVLGTERPGREMNKAEHYEISEELRTPTYSRGNKFFGVPLDSSSPRLASPRLSSRSIRRSPLERTDTLLESNDLNPGTNEDEDSILNRLRRKIRSDQKALMDLSLELDEERSASDIATNNAMAMITRLQAEKASVQMEASQYQRMMEEQAQYDQEAIQTLRDILMKKNDEIKSVEAELENYRYKYGILDKDGFNEFDDYQEFNSRTYSFISESYECETPVDGSRSNHMHEAYCETPVEGSRSNHIQEECSPICNNNISLEEEVVEERGEIDVKESSPSGLEDNQTSQILGLLTVLEKKMYLTANEEEMASSQQPNSEIGNHLLV